MDCPTLTLCDGLGNGLCDGAFVMTGRRYVRLPL